MSCVKTYIAIFRSPINSYKAVESNDKRCKIMNVIELGGEKMHCISETPWFSRH